MDLNVFTKKQLQYSIKKNLKELIAAFLLEKCHKYNQLN